MIKLVAGLLVALLFAGTASAAVEDDVATPERGRLAIVVGNSNYASSRYQDLANASNDARSISDSLKRLNFEVVTGIDLTADNWQKMLTDVEGRLNAYSAVVVFYAGHGVQVQGENYLLAVDSPDPDSAENLTSKAIKLSDIIRRLTSRDRQTFLFLDACRNNPVGGNGLAQVEAGENTFVAFATEPGKVTADGTGPNSPFTTALLKNIETPGLSISDLIIKVRNDTEALTVGNQVPWDQSNLLEQFYFTQDQQIDSAELSASLSRILSNPNMKEKLLVELASTDLQTAVLIVGEQMRSVGADAPAIPGTTTPQPGGTQVASLPTPVRAEGARDTVVSDLKTLIVGTSTDGSEQNGIDVAKNIQTELRRLGCYRMAVDGEWGKGSRKALEDYYRFAKLTPTSLEPSVDLLGDLFLRSGRVCKWKEAVKPKPQVRTTSISSDDEPTTSKKTGKKNSKKNTPAKRPAAPPPDISSGIGIGGIF